MERKTCFISDAGNWQVGGRWGGQTSVQRLSPHPKQSEVTDRNSTVCSDGHLKIGRQWSDQRHLDGFRYS